MIRHRPSGRGHPYLFEPEQRNPLRPASGERIDLGVTTGSDTSSVIVELERDGVRYAKEAVLVGEAIARELNDWGATSTRGDDGHLAETARIVAEEGRLAWRVEVEPLAFGETLRYRFTDGAESTEWFEVTACRWEADAGELRIEAPPELRNRVVPESIRFFTDGSLSYLARFAIRLERCERVVGLGERFDLVDQRGRRAETAVFDQYKGQGSRSYLPMPFGIVVGGNFGFHLETGHRARFDIAAEEQDLIQVEVSLEPGEAMGRLILHLFAGDPAEVLGSFLDQAGRPALPPEWIYRLWMSSNEWDTQERILAEVDRCEAEGIPAGAIVLEAWSDEETFVAFRGATYEAHAAGEPHRLGDFEFPKDGPWPDPSGLVEELHRRGLKVLLWQIPLAKPAAAGQAALDVQVMIERGYCVRAADGKPYRNAGCWFPDALLLDFTNEEAVKWWLAKRRYLIDEVGVDGFKTDGGEHAWAADVRYSDGSRGGETNNRYPVDYAEAYHHLLREAGRAPVTFSRAGYTGSQAFPAHWAGDEDSTWEALRASITAGITASACGVFFWSFDLGGFSGPLPTPELYLRAAAVATFAPIMQFHSEFNFHRLPSRDRTPWNVAEQSGDANVVPCFRRLARLRERLVPYLVEQGETSIKTSKPLMRGLFFDSDDDELWQFPYQYLLGDDILVAPVTETDITAQEVFLPAGDWVDAWTGDRLGGGRVVSAEAPVGQIPVYLGARRADSLLPLFAGLGERVGEANQTLVEVT